MHRPVNRPIAILTIIAVVPAILFFGCSLMQRMGLSSEARFSHAFHVKEKKIGCEDCHSTATTEEQAGMPKYDENCAPCHEDADQAKPPEKRVAGLLASGQMGTAKVTTLSSEVKFSHKAHADKGVACEDCHRGAGESTHVTSDLAVGKWKCMDCHATRGASNDCATCHTVLRKETPPDSHAMDWERLHGQASRGGSEARKYCGLCHSDENCVNCHQERKPRNHTNYFRIRGHGAIAMVDRDACKACHQVDYCDRCHSEVAPRCHMGAWGAPRERHCLTCHLPLSSNDECGVCHRGTPSHSLAAPKPSWHSPGMNCRQCHGVSQPLPHVDNGTNCNVCHR